MKNTFTILLPFHTRGDTFCYVAKRDDQNDFFKEVKFLHLLLICIRHESIVAFQITFVNIKTV